MAEDNGYDRMPSEVVPPDRLDAAIMVYVADPDGHVSLWVADHVPPAVAASAFRTAAAQIEQAAGG